jgi:hemerythrin-like metal-binding protein
MVAVLAATLGAVLFVVQSGTDDIIAQLTRDQAGAANHTLNKHMRDLQNHAVKMADIAARNETVIRLLKDRKLAALKTFLQDLVTGQNVMNVCDANGIVLVRTFSDMAGDDITAFAAVSTALRAGHPAVSLELMLVDGHFAILTSAPVYDGAVLIGVINYVHNLEDAEYLDVLREETGCYAAIFYGATRISTTLVDQEGKRATGTVLGGTAEADELLKSVLVEGNTYTGRQSMFGKTFEVCFTPLVSAGKPVGMLGASVDIDVILREQRAMQYLILLAAFTGLAAVIVSIAMSARASQKYADTFEELVNARTITAKLERLLHAMDICICMTELETDKVLFVNNRARQEFGIEDDIIGAQCWKVFQAGFDKRCEFCAKNHLQSHPDLPVVWEDRNTITGKYYKKIDRLIDWPDGTRVHLQQSEDINDRKRAETEKIKALERAEQASRAKSEFLARVSHEMKTPMNAIVGMTNLARIIDAPEKKEDCLVKVGSASRHLLKLINDILDISEMEQGPPELACADFAFTAMLRGALEVMDFFIEEKQQMLSVDIHPSMPEIFFGDAERLAQIIVNLLSNAVKFTPEQGVIQIYARPLDERDGLLTLRIEIADSGIGIPQEQQEAIFQAFEQADGGSARIHGGIGLGLAIARRIVERMDGRIWVESEPGKGAKFLFTVKLEKGRGQEAQTDVTGEAWDADEPTVSFEGKTMLLVDDVQINREIVIAMLEDTRISIDCAVNGRQALELFAADPGKYDIILMDINMPEMDGVEATHRIRALDAPEGTLVPILAVTANVSSDDIKHYHAAGMNDYIGKPLDFTVFFDKLNEHITVQDSDAAPMHADQHGIAWNDSFNIGYEQIDMQHRQAFALLNDLVSASIDGSGTERLGEMLEFLQDYAARHFHDEEALQLRYDFPGYAKHRRQHEDLQRIIGGLAQKFAANGASKELSDELNKIVLKWLTTHILHEDMKLGKYLRSVNAHNSAG